MGLLLRRLVFGCFWCAVFWIALLTIGGGIVASIAGQPAANQTALRAGQGVSRPVDIAAGIGFRERYGTHVMVAAVMLAATGTFAGILPGTRRQ